MTKAEIRTATQNLVRAYIGSAGTWLGSGNTIIDEFQEDALEDVCLDLITIRQESFLKSKVISLVADQQNYSLAATLTASDITFATGQITNTAGEFITAGFKAGMIIQASGTSNNDNTDFLISKVAAVTLTIDTDKNDPTSEGSGSSFTLTQKDNVWMIRNILRNISDKKPKEISVIETDGQLYYENVGETEAEPMQVMLIEEELYFVKTPSAAYTDYAKVWFVRPEMFNLPTYGPVYLPRAAHRMISFKAAAKITVMRKGNPSVFEAFYSERLRKVRKILEAFDQQTTMHVKEDPLERMARDDREQYVVDYGWPD